MSYASQLSRTPSVVSRPFLSIPASRCKNKESFQTPGHAPEMLNHNRLSLHIILKRGVKAEKMREQQRAFPSLEPPILQFSSQFSLNRPSAFRYSLRH